jgi:hypothetical protein
MKVVTKSQMGLYHNPHLEEINKEIKRQGKEKPFYPVIVHIHNDQFVERRYSEILGTFRKAGWSVSADVLDNDFNGHKKVKFIFS